MHVFVRFEPLPGKAAEFREELRSVIESTRMETGCVSIRAFESIREPTAFAIHSEWVDEAAFDYHAKLPHTRRFLDAVEKLLTHSIQAMRTRELESK